MTTNVVPSAEDRKQLVSEYEASFRELAAWYEWSCPPNLEAACVLQSAADAVKCNQLSLRAADVLLQTWQPHAGVEARVGNVPDPLPEDGELAYLRRAVIDLGEMMDRESDPVRKDRLKSSMREQVRRYREARA